MLVSTPTRHQAYVTMEWNFRPDGSSCRLGFNPVIALIMPRLIEWISTYTSVGRIPHLAPYSFFIDVARGSTPMIAFSAYRRDGQVKKDAQKDAEETGFFGFNLCSEYLAYAMNLSAAEMQREESEFEMAGLQFEEAKFVTAPFVRDAHIKYECSYVKTIGVGSFSIVIGSVKGVMLDRAVLSGNEGVDVGKLRPITRLGYMDQYGILFCS